MSRYAILDAVLKAQPVVQGIDRCNDLTTAWLKALILELAAIDTTYEDETKTKYRFQTQVSNYRAVRQQVTPDECNWRNMNYAFDCMVDIKLNVYVNGCIHRTEIMKDYIIMSCPTMMFSVACIMSDGCDTQTPIQSEMESSFIMRGKRRFIPYIQRLVYNEPMFFKQKMWYRCEIRSEHLDRPHRSTSTLTLDILASRKGKLLGRSNLIMVSLPYLKPKVPIHILILALGYTFKEFEESVYMMDENPEFLKSLIEPYMHRMSHHHANCKTHDDALNYIGDLYEKVNATPEERRKSILNTMKSEVLPHLNHTYDTDKQTTFLKMRYIAWLVGIHYRFSEGLIPGVMRDNYRYICFDGPADLLASLIRIILNGFNKDCVKSLRRTLKQVPKKTKSGEEPVVRVIKNAAVPIPDRITLNKIYNQSKITPKLMSAVSTGRWSEEKKGVSNPMKTTNSKLIASQLNKVSSSLSHNPGKHVDPRMIDSSSFGYICAAETPDGEKCGLNYTLAKTCMITSESNGYALMDMLIHFDLKDIFVPITTDEAINNDWWKLIGPHGVLHGWVRDKDIAIYRIRSLRRNLSIDVYTSVYSVKNQHAIYIKTNAGRATRPLLITANLPKIQMLIEKLKTNYQGSLQLLLQHSVIEYLDPAEIQSSDICVALKQNEVQHFHTHLELGDKVSLGRLASQMILSNFNQGPRLIYEIGMAKQYISPLSGDDYAAGTTHFLHYGQTPLVRTVFEDDDQCDGLNCILAFIPHANSQEDAMVFKRGFIDRGGFHSSSIRTHSAAHTPRNPSHAQDRFERPPKETFGKRIGNYDNIQDNGLPLPGTKMNVGDIVIAKTIPHTHVSDSSKVKVPTEFKSERYHDYRRDASVQLRKDEAGVLHETIQTPNMYKARVRTYRTVAQGDKYSIRNGQKGTVGKIESDENMPFNPCTGMSPDIIVGPTALPSRMTMGYLLEMILGKAVALTAMLELGVENPEFSTDDTEQMIEKIGNILKKHGFEHSGREMLCDGVTGNMLNCHIMIGPVFVGKMDHLVSKKVHARARGPVQPITWQPIEGRRNDGGFRFGNMEIDAVAAHGASQTLKGRTTGVSDELQMYVCKQCGFPAEANPQIGLYMCRYCKTGKHLRLVRQSKSAQVMFTELAADGVKTQFILRDLPDYMQTNVKRRKVE
jgi:DNA-directed RNA polymerase beta subunit